MNSSERTKLMKLSCESMLKLWPFLAISLRITSLTRNPELWALESSDMAMTLARQLLIKFSHSKSTVIWFTLDWVREELVRSGKSAACSCNFKMFSCRSWLNFLWSFLSAFKKFCFRQKNDGEYVILLALVQIFLVKRLIISKYFPFL